MSLPLVIVKFRDVIQDSSWDGPDKVNCPTVTSVGWLVERDDPVKLAGTLDDEGNPCAILAVSRERCLSNSELPYETAISKNTPDV